jgi:alanine dehydrogenase
MVRALGPPTGGHGVPAVAAAGAAESPRASAIWQSGGDSTLQEEPVIVGVPREIKTEEYRVALTPVGVRELVVHGHRVLVESGAGVGSSIDDDAYRAVGAEVVGSAGDVFSGSEMIVKVKEPQPSEIEMLRPGQVMFTFLHLAAYPEEAKGLIESGVTAIAYETVQLPNGSLPLLAPMSEIAGRMGVQAGAHYLERPRGGRGVLLGGVPGVSPGRVAVLGAGMAGRNAAMIAAGMGAQVVVLDINVGPLRHLDELRWGRVTTVTSSTLAVEHFVGESDLVVGAVLVPGARAPVVVSEDLVASMRPGSVLVDISIDQGGCIATARETTHSDPVYEQHGVIHYAVGNIPGAVPNTATYALTNATLPYVVSLADGLPAAIHRHPELLGGINVTDGVVTNAPVAEFLGVEAADAGSLIGADR